MFQTRGRSTTYADAVWLTRQYPPESGPESLAEESVDYGIGRG